MKTFYSVIAIILVALVFSYGQVEEDLVRINSKSKVMYVTPEALDQLLIQLRKFENAESSVNDTLLLETYQVISSGYAANNHFRQAYEVYRKYLTEKERILLREMNSAINIASGSISERQVKDDNEKTELQNQLLTLVNSHDKLESKRLSFKRNFSFALIILSSIFAIMIVSSGIKMISLRSKSRQSKERMKSIHRIAVIGNLEQGLTNSMKNSFSTIENQIADLQKTFSGKEQNFSPVKQSNQLIAEMVKLTAGLKNLFSN